MTFYVACAWIAYVGCGLLGAVAGSFGLWVWLHLPSSRNAGIAFLFLGLLFIGVATMFERAAKELRA